MINVTELRPGNTYVWEGTPYTCLDIDLNKTAMAKMKVKVKSKNLKTGATLDMSGDGLVFMDTETYDQVSIPKERLEWELNFLKPESIVTITMLNGEILGVELPAKVTLLITKCEPAVRGDTVNKALKDAYLETGLKVRVPLFVENNEEIIVCTNDGSYDSRAK